ncbi:helix-turn-helix domain-containing protein [Sinorhizobium garamanticum]|uniref:Helix-turn-helix domain-containing protein n=1 Tax=Sinorhizobium garamanticum TaxID=680247 RepID=A0ABY8DFY5_9HYPH|nr:helix-turn-helix transcriptional regulator [Sinorhizobium garamanticum]WEX88450.1 helix-turn-helix domain-containing protein [Sinorhizobium garamanticum]
MEFGRHLKEWRGHRRMSQLDLAVAAGISARHLSFLETGRSKPSEGMILRLASVLDIPARDQGSLFTAAGYRPRITTRPARGLDAMPPAVASAIRLMLERHAPYPGLVFDHEYTVLLTTPAFAALAEATKIPVNPGQNFLDAFLGSESIRALVINWEAAAADLVQRVRMEAWLQGPRSPLQRRLERLVADPAVARAIGNYPETDRLPVLPVELRVGSTELSFITTLSTFGSTQDALVEGVLIESFFPADDATRRFFEHPD